MVPCAAGLGAYIFAALLLLGRGRSAGVVTVRLGGSLGISGTTAVPATAVLRGATLVAETVNRTRPFKFGNSTSTLALWLAIEDDHGEKTKVAKVYKNLAETRKVDFLLGPYTSSNTLVAAEIANQSKMVIVIPSGASPVIYAQGFKYIFSVNVPAPDYMEPGLRTLWAAGARTMAVAYENGVFNEAVCNGAMMHARKLGYKVVGTEKIDEGELTDQIRIIKQLRPDVFVGCGHFRISVLTVMTARALGFVPKAILVTNAASNAFVQAVGAPNANYIVAPVSWHPLANSSACRVFGSAAKFTSAYLARFGEEPVYQSAEGAAAVIALLAAVEAAGSLDAEAVNAAMLQIREDSFYARLSFHTNGIRRSAQMRSQQVQPLPATYLPATDRYFQSQLQEVSPAQLPLWPMLGWEQKELQVYPCRPGVLWTIDSSPTSNPTALNMVCVPCTLGRYRHLRTAHCEDCEAGRYSDVVGADRCKECPVGAHCPKGLRPGRPNATAGYYTLPSAELKIVPCSPASVCVGANECLGHNRGILCWGCEAGYSNRGMGHLDKVCGKCEHGMSIAAVAMGLLYCLYVWLIVKATLASSRSLSEIHSVILKITVNYAQFAGAAFQATEFRQMIGSMFDTENNNQLNAVFKMCDAGKNPFAALMSLECLTGNPEIRVERVAVVLGLVLIPIVLTANITKGLCRQNIRFPTEPLLPMVWSAYDYFRSTLSQRRAHQITQRKAQRWVNVEPDQCSVHTLKGGHFGWVRSLIVWSWVLYAIVVSLLMEPLSCVELDQLRLMQNVEIVCGGDDIGHWATLAYGGLLLFGAGTPLLLLVLLYRNRLNLFDLSVRSKYGFLYNGYEPRYFYFEPLYMLRKVAFLFVATIPNMLIRMVCLCILSYGFLFVHAFFAPFDNRGFFCLDRLERDSLRALTLTVMSRLCFDVREFTKGTFVWDVANHRLVDILLVCVPLVAHAKFCTSVSWNLWRNTILRTMHLKAEVWPERKHTWSNACVNCERRRNKVTYSEETNHLDISMLTSKERFYLCTALSETLHRYVDCTNWMHPGVLDNAIKEALALSKKSRGVRYRHVMELDAIAHDGSWKNWLRKKLAETTMSLHASHRLHTVQGVRIEDHLNIEADACRVEAAQENGVSVEEVYSHLMQLWPDILQGRPDLYDIRKFTVEDSDDELNDECPASIDKQHYKVVKALLTSPSKPRSDPEATKLATVHVDMDHVPRESTADEVSMQELVAASTEMYKPSVEALRRRSAVHTEQNVHLRIEIEELSNRIALAEARQGEASAALQLLELKESYATADSIEYTEAPVYVSLGDHTPHAMETVLGYQVPEAMEIHVCEPASSSSSHNVVPLQQAAADLRPTAATIDGESALLVGGVLDTWGDSRLPAVDDRGISSAYHGGAPEQSGVVLTRSPLEAVERKVRRDEAAQDRTASPYVDDEVVATTSRDNGRVHFARAIEEDASEITLEFMGAMLQPPDLSAWPDGKRASTQAI